MKNLILDGKYQLTQQIVTVFVSSDTKISKKHKNVNIIFKVIFHFSFIKIIPGDCTEYLWECLKAKDKTWYKTIRHSLGEYKKVLLS